MRVVADELEIFELEIVNVHYGRVQFHPGQRTRLARELKLRLVQMVCVKMQVAEGVDEFPRFQIADLRNHQGQQGVAGNIEGHAQK